ncbi:hypothetical protein PROFUN_00567 [Planoprotostelium fungivorum]|uniref:SprT-like domain-containing protein n=1 Tax=Planoprotostelium fungivorum TaxID=1890364 RepID=A0A2P6N162_9EUKA|nr:hypothetical protein PROFUN_00567 [Planoprotostelium fungivorum]
MSNDDEQLARLLQEEDDLNFLYSMQQQQPSQLTNETEEYDTDIQSLFVHFDQLYFQSKLVAVEVKWSKRMTLCAGLCCYEGRGGMCSIKLSEPLLKYRPRKDMIDTLLHEMIHAFLFVTVSNRDRDGHGEQFQTLMHRVNNYRTHWWKCQGKCGYVLKRSMNRNPGPKDRWWSQHERDCGGNYVKIREPKKENSLTFRQKKEPIKEEKREEEKTEEKIGKTNVIPKRADKKECKKEKKDLETKKREDRDRRDIIDLTAPTQTIRMKEEVMHES